MFNKFSKVVGMLLVVVLFGTMVTSAFAAQAQMDIVDTAVADGRFTTLATALTEAGLIETLKGEGPFTVFAPTDDAFNKLPDGTIEALLADVPALTDVLLYHVVSGKVMAADVVQLSSADTVLGKPVSIKVENGNVFVNDAQVIITDIETSNGVIHVIDAVLIPPADAPAALPETGGESTTSNWLPVILALGLILALGGFGVLRFRTVASK
ncbi:MAG: fasciclin domain-containing protein [Anaerolineae bacterium]|nr:fasciclin domain-containing protein [Anaerolineae bacterium]